MGNAQDLSTSPDEQHWLDVVVTEMQVVNGLILIADPVDTPALLHTFGASDSGACKSNRTAAVTRSAAGIRVSLEHTSACWRSCRAAYRL